MHSDVAVSRRALLTSSAAAAVAAGAAGVLAGAAAGPVPIRGSGRPEAVSDVVPFFGAHQAGIATPPQAYLVFAAFDIATDDVHEVEQLLRRWSGAAAQMSWRGLLSSVTDSEVAPSDSGETNGLSAARLTVTFGFGPGLFRPNLGLTHLQPAGLQPLPAFAGDRLDDARSGGDLMVQACADDPMVAFHAVRQLRRLAAGTATMRWQQHGFQGGRPADGGSGRNLFGQRDGTANPLPSDVDFGSLVWVQGGDDPTWLVGGSYVAVRRIRMDLQRWDHTPLREQQLAVGRRKDTGGPLLAGSEQEPVDLDLHTPAGDPVVPVDAHVRLARTSPGMLRRGYSYDEGWDAATRTADAGLFFLAYVRDLGQQFIPAQQVLAERDRLLRFTTAVGSAVFAVPPGARDDGYVGESLFNSVH